MTLIEQFNHKLGESHILSDFAEGFSEEDNMDSVHAVDNVVFVDNVDLTNGIRSSIEKVHKVNKVDKEYKLYRRNINHF